jgi:transposase-like protein
MEDDRCKLGLGGRLQLVGLIEQGSTIRGAARALNVSPATAHRWWHRWQRASELERASRTCLHARPPLPKSCPWQLSTDAESRILQARSRTNLGPAPIFDENASAYYLGSDLSVCRWACKVQEGGVKSRSGTCGKANPFRFAPRERA